MSPWQTVIHGSVQKLREATALVLYDTKTPDAALRFALCGRGDVMYRSAVGKEVFVAKRGCGERACQRCSRARALRGGRRVLAHLASGEHGFLYHMVLTQPMWETETVREAAGRMQRKWAKWWKYLERRGGMGAFVVAHCTFSRRGGWHFHLHVLLEMGQRTAWRDHFPAWMKLIDEEVVNGRNPHPFVRCLSDAGPALAGVADGQDDFFEEPRGEVERVVQYVVRDAGQGSERWGLERCDAARLAEFVTQANGLKWYRVLGRWRAPVEERVEDREAAEKCRAVREEIGWSRLGTVDEVLERARLQQRQALEVLSLLREKLGQRGGVAGRVVEWCLALGL